MTTLARLRLAVAALQLCAMVGCTRSSENPPLPDITSESEDGGFHDLVFTIREHTVAPDGGQIFHVAGLYRKNVVGFELYLGPAWERISLGADIPVATYRGVVRYRSLGPESDRLVRGMDLLYETRLGVTTMNPEATFTGLALGGNPRQLAEGVVKIKLFFEPGPEDRYAELFTNIDLGSRKVYVSEKDEEYRVPLIKALAGPEGFGGG